MKIYAICVVKNEEDIIQYTLCKAEEWADKIIVFDNGSADNTWQKVRGISSSKIIAYRQSDAPYSDGLRAEIFGTFKTELKEGDWWVIQDADEEFDFNPRSFIEKQSGNFHHINGKKIDFSFDLNRIDDLLFSADFEKNIHLFRYYTPVAWSEPRAIKHRQNLKWRVEKIWPDNMGLVCDSAIPIRHYPLRSPEQIKKRWETRNNLSKRGGQYFSHWEKQDWKEYIQSKTLDLQEITDNDVFGLVPFANNYRQGLLKRIILKAMLKSGFY